MTPDQMEKALAAVADLERVEEIRSQVANCNVAISTESCSEVETSYLSADAHCRVAAAIEAELYQVAKSLYDNISSLGVNMGSVHLAPPRNITTWRK